MEWILGIATVLEVAVVAVLVYALWQDHRETGRRKHWEDDLRTATHGEELTAVTRT